MLPIEQATSPSASHLDSTLDSRWNAWQTENAASSRRGAVAARVVYITAMTAIAVWAGITAMSSGLVR
jgi:hypothetical protein